LSLLTAALWPLREIFRDSAQCAILKNGGLHNKIGVYHNRVKWNLFLVYQNSGENYRGSSKWAWEKLPMFISVQNFHLTDSQK
jgi:hypothetical protein